MVLLFVIYYLAFCFFSSWFTSVQFVHIQSALHNDSELMQLLPFPAICIPISLILWILPSVFSSTLPLFLISCHFPTLFILSFISLFNSSNFTSGPFNMFIHFFYIFYNILSNPPPFFLLFFYLFINLFSSIFRYLHAHFRFTFFKCYFFTASYILRRQFSLSTVYFTFSSLTHVDRSFRCHITSESILHFSCLKPSLLSHASFYLTPTSSNQTS